MGIYNTLKFITNHPLNSKRRLSALFTFFKWQIFSKFTLFTIVYPFAEKSKLLIKKGMSGATGNLYCGLHEFEDMSLLLHFLRPTDEFYDIGANIGSYSTLATKGIGSTTYSVEPIPSTFESLEANMAINGVLNKTNCLNIGLGSESK